MIIYYLYVKTHLITGLKYLGYTSKDPFRYRGSGKRWRRHIKKHGYKVSTEILLETCDFQKIRDAGKYYSALWNIVEDSNWANLKEEAGDGGSWAGLFGSNNPMFGTKRPQHVIEACKNANIGRKNEYLANLNKSRIGKPRSEETKRKISETKKKQGLKPTLGRKHTKEEIQKIKERKWWNNGVEEKMTALRPEGFMKGRLKKVT